MLLFFIYIIFILHNNTVFSDKSCFCNIQKCPVIGYNILHKNAIIITYFYIQNYNNQIIVLNASAIISYQSLDKGTSTNKCVEQYSNSLNDIKNTTVDAGHILAKRLGGLGTEPLNIFPQNYTINRGIYAQFENEIYQFIYKNKSKYVQLKWHFFYKTNFNTRPNKIQYSYQNITKIFTN